MFVQCVDIESHIYFNISNQFTIFDKQKSPIQELFHSAYKTYEESKKILLF